MGEFGKWLTHDDQKDLFEVLFAAALNVLFLALAALILWPLGRTALALSLAQGYAVLWIAVALAAVLVGRTQQFFRVDLYHHPDAYVISNLVVDCFLQAGWSAFAALAVRGFVAGAPVWVSLILYAVGALSCLFAFFALSSFYQGHVYKFVSLPLALAAFAVVGVWPAAGRATYGRLFDLF